MGSRARAYAYARLEEDPVIILIEYLVLSLKKICEEKYNL